MRSDHGEVLIIILFAVITIAMVIGGVALSIGVPCNDRYQHCIHYGTGEGDVMVDPNRPEKKP